MVIDLGLLLTMMPLTRQYVDGEWISIADGIYGKPLNTQPSAI